MRNNKLLFLFEEANCSYILTEKRSKQIKGLNITLSAVALLLKSFADSNLAQNKP